MLALWLNQSPWETNCSLGVRMYTRYAELLHLPRVLITESSIPALAAAVAALMRKLCLAKFCSGWPVALRASLTLLVNKDFVSGWPSWNWEKGPSLEPRIAIYCMIATTGHKGQSVLPMYTSTPLPSWSALDFFRCTLSNHGSSVLSTATSPQARYLVPSKAFSVDIVIPPERKKPKKQRVAAAQIMTMSLFVCWGDQCSFRLSRIVGVIGCRTFVDALVACVRWIPAWTSWSNDENSHGSGRPMVSAYAGLLPSTP